MKAVGRQSMGRVMPHSTPKALMASETSAPAWTSRWGMSTEVAEPIRLPSRLVSPMGDSDGGDAAVELPVLQRRAGQAARPVQMPPGQQEQGNGGEQLAQDHAGDNQPHRPLRVLGEKDHQQPQHRPVRMNCSHSSTAAGGRMLPVP